MKSMYWRCLYGTLALSVGVAIGFAAAAQKNNFLYRFLRNIYLSSTPGEDSTKTAHWRTMASQFDTLADRSSQIYMIGDSLTESGLWAEFFPDARIANRGISGDSVKGLLARTNQIPDGAPMFLMIGTNDVAANTPVEEIERDYLRLIDALSAKGKLFVQSTLLTADDERNLSIAHINDTLRNVCSSAPAKCEFVELNSAIAPTGSLEDEMTFDGQHLNGAGYLKWRQAIGPIIERVGGNPNAPETSSN